MGNTQPSNGADPRAEGRGHPHSSHRQHQHHQTNSNPNSNPHQQHAHPGVASPSSSSGTPYHNHNHNPNNIHTAAPGSSSGRNQGQTPGGPMGQGLTPPNATNANPYHHPPHPNNNNININHSNHNNPYMEAAVGAAAPTASSTSSSGMPKMQTSNSDASMDPIASNHNNNNNNNPNSKFTFNIAQLSAADDDVVPTVFRWEHGGREVYITGTFNEWTRQIPMHRSGNDFTYIHNLKRGKHAFKFIVDDEWRFAPDQPTVADIDGRINNFIDVTDFKPYTGDKSFEQEKNAAYYSKRHHPPNHNHNHTHTTNNEHAPHYHHHHKDAMNEDDAMNINSNSNIINNDPSSAPMDDPDGEVFTHNMPDEDDYTKDPPPLPPHLRHIILNKPPQLQDTAALPVPQHVALNHLYCTAIRDNMMVLGITQRFRTKFVTTVYYSPELNRT